MQEQEENLNFTSLNSTPRIAKVARNEQPRNRDSSPRHR
jgi:hypothetical protein